MKWYWKFIKLTMNDKYNYIIHIEQFIWQTKYFSTIKCIILKNRATQASLMDLIGDSNVIGHG